MQRKHLLNLIGIMKHIAVMILIKFYTERYTQKVVKFDINKIVQCERDAYQSLTYRI